MLSANNGFINFETNLPESKYRKTTLMVNLSDFSLTPVDIQMMLEAGLNVAKFRMSRTTKDNRLKLINKINEAALLCCQKTGVDNWPIATCMVLKTAIIKTGILKEDLYSINIKEDTQVILTCNLSEYDSCDAHKIFVDNNKLTSEVKIGMEISIGEDEILLQCIKIRDEDSIICKVSKGGRLCNLDRVKMIGVEHKPHSITKTDYEIIKFALEYQVDILIVYYVRQVQTLKTIKKFIGNKVKRPFLISGISTQQGLNNIDEIAKESDAILMSRNFMPFELDVSKRLRLGQIQKWLGAKCEAHGKPYFLAGDIFQDTLDKGELSACEVSDVANAILDGATGFILNEGANVNYILTALKYIDEICRMVEPYKTSKSNFLRVINEMKVPLNAAEGCILGCVTAAYQVAASAIIIPTVTGYTVQALQRISPPCKIIAVTTKTSVMRMLTSCKCIPLMYTGKPHKIWQMKTDARIQFAVDYAVNRGLISYGDMYVTLQRHSEYSIYSDTVKIYTTRLAKKPLVECSNDDDVEEALQCNLIM
ncbi:hypothetical protein ACJJTC_003028 [Scirpophaga incertulas]